MNDENKIHNTCCPVCIMSIKDFNIAYKYREMDSFFCSEQCQDRFISNPHLYIGHWGRSGAKQRGECIIKRRIIKLEKSAPDYIVKLISRSLSEMMGVKKVSISGERISISYDLLEVTAKQIEIKIEIMGEHIKDNWVEDLKLAFIHYIEETEIDNLEQDTCSSLNHYH